MIRFRKATRRLMALLVGLPLLAVGIILIPLPGPGLLLCFLALYILSREFDWASQKFEIIKDKLVKIYKDSK